MGKISMIRRIHSCQHSFFLCRHRPWTDPGRTLYRLRLSAGAGEHSHRPGEPDPGRLCHSPRRGPAAPALAALSACAYLLLGFAGLPVFAGFAAGPGVLFGMTGGYLLAYPIMAWLLSMVCEKTRSRGVRMAGVALANLCCYLLGTAWFMAATGMGLWASLSACVIPFYPARPCKGLVCPLAGRAPR